MPNTTTIHNNDTIVASGQAVHRGDPEQEIVLLWNITGPVTGTSPTIQFTIQEVDPVDESTLIGQSAASPIIITAGVGNLSLHLVNSPTALISWVVGGTSPSFGGVNATAISKVVGNQVAVVTPSEPILVNTTGTTVQPTSGGITDPGQSTTALLAPNATFLGAGPFGPGFSSCAGYSTICVSVYSNQVSATPQGVGIFWDYDGSGTYAPYLDDQFYIYTNLGFWQLYVFHVKAPFFQVQYANGAAAQTAFALTTSLKVSSADVSVRADQAVSGPYLGESVRGMLIIGNNNDVATVIRADAGGNLGVTTPQLPAALVGGRLETSVGSWLGSGAPTVGQKTAANSLPVVLASDQAAIRVSNPSGSAVVTTVGSSIASVTLLSANANRKGATIVNNSTQVLFVKFGVTASNASFTVRMVASGYYEVPFSYTGRIDGIWAGVNGNAQVTELT